MKYKGLLSKFFSLEEDRLEASGVLGGISSAGLAGAGYLSGKLKLGKLRKSKELLKKSIESDNKILDKLSGNIGNEKLLRILKSKEAKTKAFEKIKKTISKTSPKRRALVGLGVGAGVGLATNRVLKQKNNSNLWESLYDYDKIHSLEKKGYPKFVIDYLWKIQPLLKERKGLCYFCVPVIFMRDGEIEKGEYNSFFSNSIDDGLDFPLVWKDGEWFEKSGIFFKKYKPISSPAKYILEYLTSEVDLEDPENQRDQDFQQFKKVISELRKLK